MLEAIKFLIITFSKQFFPLQLVITACLLNLQLVITACL